MRRLLVLLVVAVALAGCSARANKDALFGYMKKPVFASSFPLADARAVPQSQQFFVEDGSIASLQIQVWVNATAGGATVSIVDAHGDEVLRTTQSTTVAAPLDLGAWKVTVAGTRDATGQVDILVMRH
ncbi:MAG: hypothetical protein QOE90_2559 [Thermoplasmata archaeon]|jgi:hypothetical protein|nr:hypothetical protein [Thermoplasmata archaeon]